MKITGPYIRKEIVVPEHTVMVFDEDAYWQLNWQGEADGDGGFFYAKVAFPSVRDAQRQHATEATAREAERKPFPHGNRGRKRKTAAVSHKAN